MIICVCHDINEDQLLLNLCDGKEHGLGLRCCEGFVLGWIEEHIDETGVYELLDLINNGE